MSLFALTVIPVGAQQTERPTVSQPAASPAPSSDPLFVILGMPADLNALLSRFANPDFVLLDGSRYQALLDRSASQSAPQTPTASLRSVLVSGRLGDDQADLDLRFEFLVEGDQAVLAPLRLDGLVLSEVTRDGQPIPVSVVPGSGWTAELQGSGRQVLRVRLSVPVRVLGQQRRLDLPLAEAPMTRLELTAPPGLLQAALRTGESLTILRDQAGQATIAGLIPPRPRLELDWSTQTSEAEPPRPVLSAQVELAITIESGSARIQSTATLRAERGSASELGLDLDPSFEDVEYLIDAQPFDPRRLRADPTVAGRVWIPRPLNAQKTLELTIRARRPLPRDESATWLFRGIPIVDTPVQTGLLAISASDDLVVTGRTGPGLRPIDPRTELSPTLRARPSVILAYRLLTQPFQLELRTDPSRPWLSCRTRSTLWSDDGQSLRIESWFDFRGPRGRLARVAFDVPNDFQILDVGPPESIASSAATARSPTSDSSRQLVLRLADSASASGQFSIRLIGSLPITPGAPVAVALPAPRDVDGTSGLLALVDTRDIALQALHPDGSPRSFGPAPSAWTWPAERPDLRSPRIAWIPWQNADQRLVLEVESLQRQVATRHRVELTLDRLGIDLRQEIELLLEHGQLDSLELQLPAGIEPDWQLLGVDVRRRRFLSAAPESPQRVLLELARPIDVRSSLRLRGRVAFAEPIAPGSQRRIEIPEFGLVGIPAASRVVSLSAEAGLELEPEGDAWLPSDPGDPSSAWTRRDHQDPPRLHARLRLPRRATLPPLFIRRAVVATTWMPDASVSVECRVQVARHEGQLVVELPNGSEWIGARVGAQSIEEIEALEPPGTFRLRLPPNQGESLVELSYVIPRASERGRWWGPRFSDQAAVGALLWEVRLPHSYALLGAPTGWDDLNEWAWSGYFWRRQPQRSALGLLSDAPRSSPASTHNYLFGRSGNPNQVSLWIVSRPYLLASSSLAALAVTLLTLAGWQRWPGMIAAFWLAAGVLATSRFGILVGQVLQSGLAGVGLGILVATLWRRKLQTSGPASSLRPSHLDGARPVEVVHGPEDSTIVRRRAPSTASRGSAVRPDDPGDYAS